MSEEVNKGKFTVKTITKEEKTMETFGLGMVLNYGRWLLGIVSVIVWGVLAGCLGFFLSRKMKKNKKKEKYFFLYSRRRILQPFKAGDECDTFCERSEQYGKIKE